jgi:hypothetical protein
MPKQRERCLARVFSQFWGEFEFTNDILNEAGADKPTNIFFYNLNFELKKIA